MSAVCVFNKHTLKKLSRSSKSGHLKVMLTNDYALWI